MMPCSPNTDLTALLTSTEFRQAQPRLIMRMWDEKIDVWALGCLTYEFPTGTSLFKLDKSLNFSEDIYISRQQLALLTQSGDFPDSDYFGLPRF
ncbi:hypothetical protein DFP72DRAFT_252868 [Ephemerocybe angulata]|uniref:Protein kinase domain-containing protein n=1 Tax=Ephemerocybe angulata TaxID=980116 RepID=A0A8H6I3K4_9AGAR|nr:hypothetical protein DFP72DRAFT_252868 [Tulosesus angulatus]